VLVPKIGTLRIDFEGEEYYIAQDKEILAVINQAEDNE
jgi:co-chaperonin GroES (HSP10)